MTEVFPHVPGHPFPESCADPSHDGLRGQRTLNAQVAFIESLRPPRNSLGILCLPKSLMEYAVEDAWEGATEPLGDPADGIEIHNLSELADGIVSALVARLIDSLSAGDKAAPKLRAFEDVNALPSAHYIAGSDPQLSAGDKAKAPR